MNSPYYFLIGFAAVSGLWFLWNGPVKGLALDAFRERIFEIRFRLFQLGMDGKMSFDGETYRTLETLLNGLLRYGHRVTFMSYLYSRLEDARARKSKEYVDFGKLLALKVEKESPENQRVITGILKDTHSVLVVYMCVTSLFFVGLAVAMLTLRAVHVTNFSARLEVGEVIEREAFKRMSGDRRFQLAA